jgi:hypothetical protein
MLRSDERFGTFDLWHRSCRSDPLIGSQREHGIGGGFSRGYRVLGMPGDVRLPLLPSAGISLLECLQCIPQMASHLYARGLKPASVRASVAREYLPTDEMLIITIHEPPPN